MLTAPYPKKIFVRIYRQVISRIWILLLLTCLCSSAKAQYNVHNLVESGRIALHYEDYVLSIQYFNQAISQKPYLYEPWLLRAEAKIYLEDWQGAESDATKAIELNPYITGLYDLRGISRIRQKDYAGAIYDYTKAIAQDPTNRNYWYNRALCYFNDKRYDEAQLQLDTMISKWSGFALPYLLKTETYMCQKDTVTAMVWLGKSLEKDPYNADAWRVRGQYAMTKEQWSDADTYLSKALHLKSRDVASLTRRAIARLKLNNIRGAMADYDMALEVDPNNFLAHYNRGLLRQEVGDDNRAIEDFDYVLALEPGNIMALFNRATLLDRTGNLRAAIRDYSLVIDKFPNFWTGLQYRADCYRRLGMIAKAEKDEFVILKAQMDKHLGIQHRWSRQKLSAMRKLSDIDPEKYNNLVVEEEDVTEQEYKSEYRGKVQNRQATEQFMPYIALTLGHNHAGVSTYVPFDKDADAFINSINGTPADITTKDLKLGEIGEGTGVETFAAVDSISAHLARLTSEKEMARYVLLRSIAYSSAQNYQDALNDINTAASIMEDSKLPLWQRAVCEAMMTEFANTDNADEAGMMDAGVISDFNKLEKIDPDNAYILYCHGTFLARRGHYKEAEVVLSKAIALNPDIPQAYYNRGLVYQHSGKPQKAKSDFGKAGELGLYSAYSLIKKNK